MQKTRKIHLIKKLIRYINVDCITKLKTYNDKIINLTIIKSCIKLKRNYIGMEMSSEYFKNINLS